MSEFPRTEIDGLSVSRMIIGTGWFLGCSHTSRAKDAFLKAHMTSGRIADIIEVFLRAGVDTLMGFTRPQPHLLEAIKLAEDRVGRKVTTISTPSFDIAGTDEAGAANAAVLDEQAQTGVSICMPHMSATDPLTDKATGTIRQMDGFVKMIRERGMIPGLSTHMPEVPTYADETGLDVATYIQIYNAAGFLMQVEADWARRIIWNASKPVITIKPLAAGRLLPLVGLAFSWATIRDCDMVTIGTITPDEAREVIDISLSILDRRQSKVALQTTRSKTSVTG